MKFANRLKRTLPKFRGDRSEVRGVHGRSKFVGASARTGILAYRINVLSLRGNKNVVYGPTDSRARLHVVYGPTDGRERLHVIDVPTNGRACLHVVTTSLKSWLRKISRNFFSTRFFEPVWRGKHLEIIDFIAAIRSVKFSSKSELSSRFFGRLKFLAKNFGPKFRSPRTARERPFE